MRQSTTTRVTILLYDSTGTTPALGVRPADVLSGNYTATKSDGTTTDVALVFNTNWFETDQTKAPGQYQLLVAATENNLLDGLSWSVQPIANSTKFRGVVGSTIVESVTGDVAAVKSEVDAIYAVRPATTAAAATDVTAATTAVQGAGAHTLLDLFGLLSVRSSTAQAGGASTITLDAGASATDSLYKGLTALLTGGTGAGQARAVVGYVGATKVATVAPTWAVNPDNTSTFALRAPGGADLELWGLAAPNALQGGRVDTYVGAYGAGLDPLHNLTSDATQFAGAQVATIKTNTDSIYTRIGAPAGASIAADIAAVLNVLATRSGYAAQAGSASTITLDAGASSVDNLYRGDGVFIASGTGAGQSRIITGYVGMTRVATVAPPWTTVPDNTSVPAVLNQGAGEYVRWVFQALFGRLKIDSAAKTQAIYAEDGTTVLRTSNLKDFAGAATATAATERVPT